MGSNALLNGNKTFTTGGGGAVLTQDDNLGKLVRHLSSTARTGVAYQHDMVAFNYRMPNLNAAIGLAQLENFETFMNKKREISRTYKKAFEGSVFGDLPDAAWCKSAHWLSGLTIPEDFDLTISEFIRALNQVGVEAKPFWVPMHLQEPYKNSPRSMQIVTDKIWEKVVILPCSTSLTSEDQELVIDKVRNLAKV
jgi:dTDP-4-amino-4,6-dideoxygalactose transaminase